MLVRTAVSGALDMSACGELETFVSGGPVCRPSSVYLICPGPLTVLLEDSLLCCYLLLLILSLYLSSFLYEDL